MQSISVTQCESRDKPNKKEDFLSIYKKLILHVKQTICKFNRP